MGYTFDCDGCGGSYHEFPPFAGEFTEQFLKTAGGKFAMKFNPGEKVTVCADCMALFVLTGEIAVCQRCGYTQDLIDLPDDIDECPNCERDEWVVRRKEVAQ